MTKQIEENRYVKWLSELSKKDVKLVGGKGANLAEMFNMKMPVPPAFVIAAESYLYFLEETELKDKIYSKLGKLDVDNTQELEEVAKEIREMIEKAEIPEDMQDEILESYEALNVDKDILERASSDALAILKKGYEPVFVAVRSSATAEDTEAASFAGQQETFLNVKGKTDLIEAIKKCFASLFTARSIYYRIKKGFKHEAVLIAVVVQIMINSDKSGVIFSRDPVEMTDNVIIEAVFGLGEGIVSGRIQPDHYIVSRELKILDKSIVDKKIALFRNSSGKTEIVNLTKERSESQVLTDYEIKRLASYALQLEEHYRKAQDIEFAIDSGKIFIVQTRPITTLEKRKEKTEISGKEILQGIPASPGIGSGGVKIVYRLEDLNKIKRGDVLVTKMTNPDMVVTMQKCSAIITDEGGVTAHAAIVSREMGIPCIVGTKKATQILRDGMQVTVNGSTGKIYEGKTDAKAVEILPIVNTKTKIKVIVDLPDFAGRASRTGIKSIGLTRLEGIIAESGKHPFWFLKQGKIDEYEKIIEKGVSKIMHFFDEAFIRTSDIRSDEFRNLEGASKEIEANPMLGMHGIRASLKYPEILKAEISALNKAAKGKIIGLLLPQVISVEEVRKVKKIVKELGADLKIGVMIETPAAVQIIRELCEEGISFISFGTNDLTQYTLAIDRGNESVQYLYDETHPSILSQLSYVIRICKKYQVESSICGQAGSDKKMVEFLVNQGIDSISVNADKAREISEFVAELEKGLKVSEFQENNSKEENMARKSKEKQIEEIDNLDKIEKEAEKIIEEVEEEKKEIAKENKIEVQEEWKDVDIGIDVFSDQGKGNEEKPDREESKEEEHDVQDIIEQKEEAESEEEHYEQEPASQEKAENDEFMPAEKEEESKEEQEEDEELDIF